MRVFAEFIGGPLDGEVRLMPDDIREWRVKCPPHVETVWHGHLECRGIIDEHIYRAEQQLRRRAPTGEPIYRFMLV